MKVLMIGAHQDDNEFRCGGLAHRLTKMGHEVRLVSCCNGSGGHHIMSPEETSKKRAEESAAVAKLLGIRDKKITRYVFRNAVLPQVTGLALSIGSCVGGALIVEIVFSYPGIGSLLYQSIRNIDYTLLSGCTLMISTTVLIANFLVELVYGVLDPRVRSAHTEEG